MSKLSLDDIKAKCVEDMGCLLWRGRKTMAGLPCIANLSARRIVYKMAKGPIPKGAVISVTCDCQDCLEPSHLVARSKSKVSKQAILDKPDMLLRRSVKVAAWRRANSKLTMELAHSTIGTDETCEEAAARVGVSPSAISKIRRGEIWRDLRSPFAALLRTP